MNVKRIISVLLFAISIAMIGSGVYIMNSGKYIFDTAVSKLFKAANNMYYELYDNSRKMEDFDSFKLTTSNNIKQSGSTLAELSGDFYLDIENKKAYADFDSKFNEDEFLGAELFVTDEKLYFKLKEAMNKFYYEEISVDEDISQYLEEYYETFKLLEKEDFKMFMDYLEESILESISNDEISKTSETITLASKKHKTQKISVNFSLSDMSEIAGRFLELVSKDDNAIKVLKSYNKELEKKDIEDAAKELLDKNGNEDELTEDNFALSLYVQGLGNVVRFEMSEVSDEGETIPIYVLDVYQNEHKQKTYILTLRSDGETVLEFKSDHVTKTKSNFNLSIDELELNGIFSNEEKEQSLDFDIIIENENFAKVSLDCKTIKEDKEYSFELNVTNKNQLFEFSSINNIKIDESIPEVDIDGAKLFSEISDTEYDKIIDYINKKLAAAGFPTIDDEEEDSYEDDYFSSYYDNIDI